MAEYWKSTPRYWCKHCAVYVRDTALERSNHEATGRHQGALRRSLRGLHRDAEREEKEKEHARREVARLNGLVPGSGNAPIAAGGSGDGSGGPSAPRPAAATATASATATVAAAAAALAGGGGRSGRLGTAAAAATAGGGNAPPGAGSASQPERERQLEQLALLGVNIPTELRRNMALAGEWKVTSSRVIGGTANDGPGGEEGGGGASAAGKTSQARVVGVKRERERTEEEVEQEEAIRGLTKTKKPRRMTWGVGGGKTMPGGSREGDDDDLDALLSGPLTLKSRRE